MKRAFCSGVGRLKRRTLSGTLRGTLRTGNCRSFVNLSRGVRVESVEDGLGKKWQELLQHATIERDSEKILRLIANLKQ